MPNVATSCEQDCRVAVEFGCAAVPCEWVCFVLLLNLSLHCTVCCWAYMLCCAVALVCGAMASVVTRWSASHRHMLSCCVAASRQATTICLILLQCWPASVKTRPDHFNSSAACMPNLAVIGVTNSAQYVNMQLSLRSRSGFRHETLTAHPVVCSWLHSQQPGPVRLSCQGIQSRASCAQLF